MGTSPRGPMVGPIVTRLIIHRNIKQPQALDQLFFCKLGQTCVWNQLELFLSLESFEIIQGTVSRTTIYFFKLHHNQNL